MKGFFKASGRPFDRLRDRFRDADTHARVGAIGDTRFYVSSVEEEFLIKHSIVAALQGLPIGNSLIPSLTLWGILPTLQIIKSGLVRGDEAATGSHLDREVTERKTSLHREVAHHRTRILNKIACCT